MTSAGANTMRISAGQVTELTPEFLQFCVQLGAAGVVVNTPPLDPRHASHRETFLKLRLTAEEWGLRLEAVENIPLSMYRDIIVGGPNSSAQTDHYCQIVRDLGSAGIGTLGLHWMANGVARTSFGAPGRGGSLAMALDMAEVDATPETYARLDIIANLHRFLQTVAPVAEASEVVIALHPDDPPGESVAGIGQALSSLEDFEVTLQAVGYPSVKLNFCLGSWAEMGLDPLAPLERFAARGQIAYAHFRNVQGAVPSFQETFLDEGDVDVIEALRILRRSGFAGCIIDDHVPLMVGESVGPGFWGYRGHAYATGYLMGALAAQNAEMSGG